MLAKHLFAFTLALFVAGPSPAATPVTSANTNRVVARVATVRESMDKERQYVGKLKDHAVKTGNKNLVDACQEYETLYQKVSDLEKQDRMAYRESDRALMALADAHRKYDELVDQALAGQANFDKVKAAWVKYNQAKAEYLARQADWGKVRQSLEDAQTAYQTGFSKVMELSGK